MKKTLLVILLATLVTLPLFAREISVEQKISGLYVAFFNRAPDKSGLTAWKTKAQTVKAQGNDPIEVLKEIAAGFSIHPVFTSTYGAFNNEQFVRAVYVNALGREGDSEGIANWTSFLDDGMSRADMVAIFIELSLTIDLTPENLPNLSAEELAAAQLRQNLISNKVEVAVEFVNELGDKTNVTNLEDIANDPAYLASIKVLSGVNEDISTVTDAIVYLNDAEFSDNPIVWINSNWSTFIETTLAEATTQNAFKAYDAMSVATYLPSLFAYIYEEITDGGVGGPWTCVRSGGSIDVSFISVPEDIDSDFSGYMSYLGSYEFDNCLLDIDGIDVLLDGKILSYSLPKILETETFEMKNLGTEIVGYIKSGFKIEIDNDLSITYKAFPFKGSSKIMEYFDEDGEGSFFEVSNYTNGIKGIISAVSFEETTIGDIIYAGSSLNTLDFTGEGFLVDEFGEEYNAVEKGIYVTAFSDDTTNIFFTYRDNVYWNRYGELLIYINSNEYFKTDNSLDARTSLMGKNNKYVTVWQDNDEIVHAETESTADYSLSVHTPSFN